MSSEVEIMPPEVRAELRTPPSLPAVRNEMSVGELLAQVEKIQEVMKRVMVESDPEKGIDGHYGKIPGTNKPTLLKAGAEKLCVVFRLRPEFDSTETWDGTHLTIKSRCTLVHIPTGQSFGTGEGMCSTKESKYSKRKAERVCPKCGKPAIIKGREEYGGGWLCFKKKDGCNAKFKDGDQSIESQEAGTVENPDLPDLYNTVLKMANKRAHVAAVLLSTGASDIFTQDMEDAPARPPATSAPVEPKVKTPEEQKEELLSSIYGMLRKNKLMSAAAADERSAALWHAFARREWDAVKTLDIQALREGKSVLEAMLTQRTHPGDESIPFGDDK